MHVDPSMTPLKLLIAIFAIGMFVRLVNSKRIGLLAFFVIAGGFLTYGARQSRIQPPAPPHRHPAAFQMSAAPVQVAVSVAVEEPPMPPAPEKPARPKRSSKSKTVTKAVPAAPQAPPIKNKDADTPPEPPMATVAEVSQPDTPAESVEPEAPLTLYHGTSTIGRPVEALPDWVSELAGAGTGSNSISFSSDRFATIEEAEKQLWDKARDFVARDLRQRIPDAIRWSPSPDLLKSKGFIVERCVERTAIEVGQFVEPMYRVHWKASLSSDVRASVVDAWRPKVQEERLEATALGFLGVTALLAFMNIILRLAPCPTAKKTPPAAT